MDLKSHQRKNNNHYFLFLLFLFFLTTSALTWPIALNCKYSGWALSVRVIFHALWCSISNNIWVFFFFITKIFFFHIFKMPVIVRASWVVINLFTDTLNTISFTFYLFIRITFKNVKISFQFCFYLFTITNLKTVTSADLDVQLNHWYGVYSNYWNTLLRNLKLSPYINFYV